jgi:hypothetical protein
MEATDELLAHSLRFAPLDTGCRFQMALSMEREWEKRKDGSQNYPGGPGSTEMHETNHVT